MTKKFLCGAGRADVTPAIGTLLFGYNPHQVSTSVHDNLNVTAVAFSNGEETAVMITATVGEVKTALSDRLRAEVAKACGIPFANVVISATHTHSAPNVAGMEGWGDVDEAYVTEFFLPGILSASKAAVANMKPAVIGIGTTHSEVGINRRQIYRGGNVGLGQSKFGCYDPAMTVISVRDEEGKGIVNLVHYGCHGTAAGCNHEISRDWSGIMCDRLEKISGTLTAYWQGCCGDVGPRLTNGRTTGDISDVEELGGVAANDAVYAYRKIKSFRPGELSLFKGTVKLPFRELPSLEFVNAKLASYDNPEKLYNIEGMIYAYFRDVKTFLESGKPGPESFNFDQTLVSIGEVLFVPFPFEVFSEITLRLREYTGWAHTLSLSVTNGANAYLPSKDQIPCGGYEVACFRYQNVHSLSDDAEEHIISENLRIAGV